MQYIPVNKLLSLGDVIIRCCGGKGLNDTVANIHHYLHHLGTKIAFSSSPAIRPSKRKQPQTLTFFNTAKNISNMLRTYFFELLFDSS